MNYLQRSLSQTVSRTGLLHPTTRLLQTSIVPLSRSASTTTHSAMASPTKQKLVVVGTGWAGFTLSQDLNDKAYDLTVISPSRTTALTPLLASAACGIFEFRIAEEPVRRRHRQTTHLKALVESIDLSAQTLFCRSAITLPGTETSTFTVPYDKLVLAPGCTTNTFNTPGVAEHALFMKTVSDAQALRKRILDLFEIASLPTSSEAYQREILHIVLVGGGPTGIELAAEIDELIQDHLYGIYPSLKGKATLAVHDVAPAILGSFDKKLGEYAIESFQRRSVEIKTESHIEKVEADALWTKEDGRIGYGALVWATGNKQVSLVEGLDVKKSDKPWPRILTDKRLRVLKPDEKGGEVFENVFALGDAADIDGVSLPPTAEVAVQKAKYVCRLLNVAVEPNGSGAVSQTFTFEQKDLVAYLGQHDGVVEGPGEGLNEWTGAKAWLAWRNGSLYWNRSWRRKAMVCINWLMNFCDGREIARR